MASTGMSWDEVLSELDLPRLQSLKNYWRSYPPLHLMVANYLGYKPQPKVKEGSYQPSESEFTQMMESFPTASAPVYMSAEEYKRRRSEVINNE